MIIICRRDLVALKKLEEYGIFAVSILEVLNQVKWIKLFDLQSLKSSHYEIHVHDKSRNDSFFIKYIKGFMI